MHDCALKVLIKILVVNNFVMKVKMKYLLFKFIEHYFVIARNLAHREKPNAHYKRNMT